MDEKLIKQLIKLEKLEQSKKGTNPKGKKGKAAKAVNEAALRERVLKNDAAIKMKINQMARDGYNKAMRKITGDPENKM